MKDTISLLLYTVVLLTFVIINEHPILFIFLAWGAGYWKEYFGPKK
jgi:hypothetical protein